MQNLIEDVKQLDRMDPNIGQSICQSDLDRSLVSEIIKGKIMQDERLDNILKLINTRGIHQKIEVERNETPDFKYNDDPLPVYRLFDAILQNKIKLRL